jgi:hypothetical protein
MRTSSFDSRCTQAVIMQRQQRRTRRAEQRVRITAPHPAPATRVNFRPLFILFFKKKTEKKMLLHSARMAL